ncbi:hypothetical protein FQR65_LT01061 [Abscondita terminalis]|nr:hypothetical protein FQR65_LT01061 [Abscondita terminalis]
MFNKADISIERESIVRSLLISTNAPNSSTIQIPPKISTTLPETVSNSYLKKDINIVKYNSSTIEKIKGVIGMDHCYARPLNWTPESSFFQPTKLLFMPPDSKNRKSTNPLAPEHEIDEIIDVETVTTPTLETYDKVKAVYAMDECDRHASFGRVNQGNENWEDSISRVNWTPAQNRLFNGMVNILNSDRLARLAHSDAFHEPVLRRITVDKSVKRVRNLLATISWNPRLTQWLHQLLIDNLSTSYLGAYLDILQTLKSKLPTFVDKMMYGPNASSRVGATSNESLFHLLKRPWDPFANNPNQSRTRKLPGNPILIIVPSSPSITNPNQLRRQHKWITLLSTLSTVVAVHTNMGSSANRLTMTSCADQMLTATRAKVQEVKADYPGRPIVLVGFNVGAALALQVAQVEHVVCVVCLGFSLLTAEGKRGEPDDNILELQCPVLFVIGQCSNTSLRDDIEDLRERMRVENGLIVVGSADDYLRVSKKRKRSEGLTQGAVDRLVVENVGEFVSGLLLSPFPPQMRQSPIHGSSEIPPPKRTKIERKRNNSNGSSIDSEPPSPTPKISRPGKKLTSFGKFKQHFCTVGRPPGSKGKSKLEAKWTAQVTQGIPSPSSDTPLPLHELSHAPLSQPLSESLPNKTSINKFNLNDSQSSISENTSPLNNQLNKSNSAKMHAMGLNRSSVLTSGTALANLLQNGCKSNIPIPPSSKQNCSIKVLENVTLNPGSNAKLISGPGNRSIDLSKLSLLSSNNSKSGPVVLLPDGKLKSLGSTVKGTGNTPILLPMSKNKLSNQSQTQTPSHRVTKYITSKKQLVGQKPQTPTMKPTIISSYSTNLPPPTNLTSQDIMDLPIIFADDNQMLTENSKLHASDIPVSEIVQSSTQVPKTVSNPVGKFVFINKQMPITTASLPTTMTNTTTTLKRPTLSVPVRTTNPLKYTKIIISRGASESKPSTTNVLSKISNLSPEISIRKVESSPPPLIDTTMEDIENSIVSITIKKPDHHISQIKDQEDSETVNRHVEQNVIGLLDNESIPQEEPTINEMPNIE